MAALNPTVIDSWISSLENIDWLNFRSLGLNALRHLHAIPLRHDILRAATRYWDPELHVFRFGIQELCPTVEEFHAYLGNHTSTEPITPSIRVGFAKILRDKLGLGDGQAKFLLRENTLNILRLFADYSPPGNVTDFNFQNRRMFALCMCLLGLFLLVSNDGNASPAIVGVAAQIEQRRDVVPMVLAETLMGLDAVHSRQSSVFGGSPLLLQMWLCDKVRLLADPREGQVYEARLWLGRKFVVHQDNEDEWADFFVSLGEEDIAWRCNWLTLPDMTGVHMGDSWVVLAGLAGYAFYFPQRILRQFGIRQEVQYSVPPTFHLPDFKHAVLEFYRRTWSARQIWACDHYPTIHLKGSYRKWIRKEIEERYGGI